MAGESAAELARRQREKAERLNRSAELYERGADGERATAEKLAQLPAVMWTVVHDIRWPGRPSANVDHVVIGPPGVFVIDSKNWSGSIGVADGMLRQNGRSREAAVDGAAEAARAVGRLAPLLRPDLVRPVLCLVRDEPIAGSAKGVTVCSTANVVSMLYGWPPVLNPDEVRQVCHDLQKGLAAASRQPAPARPGSAGVAGSAVAASASRAAAPKPPRRRRPPMGKELIKVAVVLLAMGALATHPEVLTNISSAVSEQLVSNVQQPAPDEPAKKHHHRHAKQRAHHRVASGASR